MAGGRDQEVDVRFAASLFLNEVAVRRGGLVTFADVENFEYGGERIPLLDRQRGIRKPRQLMAALSIRTVFAADPRARPYEDEFGDDGYLRYKWRGSEPDHAENRSLRAAMTRRLPLIWFQGAAPGTYVPVSPVWLVDEEVSDQQFVVALDEQQLANWEGGGPNIPLELARRYGERVVKQRLHQPVFRARVILAYQQQCALCRLRHVELLDAAHIRSDARGGMPVVPNGIAMCKIHHAAFDVNIVGVRPDCVIEVRPDVLSETDGPTLTHALQGLHEQRILLPRSRASMPDPTLLEERYEAFRRAS